jgi:hypothetical protein
MNEMKELKLQAEIDNRISELIEIGDDIIAKLGPNISKIDANQIRNVMAVANSAPHPAVVTNFIRYQIGRQATAKAWKETGLGNAVIGAIEDRVRRLAEEADKAARVGNVSDVQIRMTRLLLGFMNYRYVYEADKDSRRQKQEKHR